MKFTLVLLLLLFGCGDSGHDTDLHDTEFERVDLYDGILIFERVGMPECIGTILLPEIPVERDLLFADVLRLEFSGEDALLRTETGRLVIAGRESLQGIFFEEFAHFTQIESEHPIRYAEIHFQRTARFVDGGEELRITDYWASEGDTLTCWHEFTMD